MTDVNESAYSGRPFSTPPDVPGRFELSDRELLESLLNFAMLGNNDVTETATQLLGSFGNVAGVISEEPALLSQTHGLNERALELFGLVRSVAIRMARRDIHTPVRINSIDEIISYCRTVMARLRHEQLRVIFLDQHNGVIADEVMQNGTFDYVSVFPRDIIRKAILHQASALILVHNHPSGDPTPSKLDIIMTGQVVSLAQNMEIEVYDHLIIGRNSEVSLRRSGFLP